MGLRLGGQDYRIEAPEDARLTVSRALSGLHLRLRVAGRLVGPCWRCLDEAAVPITIDAREFVAAGRAADAPFEEGLDSVYVADERVDAALWVRDAFAEAVPPMILCRPDCVGLCPQCGVNRNHQPCECVEERSDPRWAGLREAAARLGLEPDRTGDR
ncbi:MAG TPA: DUF177 domain-containing protein [Miltoncostaeaceae bacterium]|nr:DUF177 domain-containing protein [Miltoncostaeaceae bacterium]